MQFWESYGEYEIKLPEQQSSLPWFQLILPPNSIIQWQGSKSIFKCILPAQKQRESKQVVSSERKRGRGKKKKRYAISKWILPGCLAFAVPEGFWCLNGRKQNWKEKVQDKRKIYNLKFISHNKWSQGLLLNGFWQKNLLDFNTTVSQHLLKGAGWVCDTSNQDQCDPTRSHYSELHISIKTGVFWYYFRSESKISFSYTIKDIETLVFHIFL